VDVSEGLKFQSTSGTDIKHGSSKKLKKSHGGGQRNSPTSPTNSSDFGLSVSDADPSLSAEKIKEQADAKIAIKDLKDRGSSTNDLTCRVCDPARVFTAYTSLLTHLQSHAGAKKFKCHVCKMSFGRQQILNYHMSVHLDEKRFVCPDCGRTFRHPYYFRQHLRSHDPQVTSKSTKGRSREGRPPQEPQESDCIPPGDPSGDNICEPYASGDHSSSMQDFFEEVGDAPSSTLVVNSEPLTGCPDLNKLSKENETPFPTAATTPGLQQPPPPIQIPTGNSQKERTTPPLTTSLVKINMRSSSTNKNATESITQKRKAVNREVVKIWQQTFEDGTGSVTYVPLNSQEIHGGGLQQGSCKIFKDVSNVSSSSEASSAAQQPVVHTNPKAILATLNGRQVLLIPKTTTSTAAALSDSGRSSSQLEQLRQSKLEQALRFGSASVESSNLYQVSNNQPRRSSSNAESSNQDETDHDGLIETKI